ncbi:MAG TPA: ATP-binding cassette domain-containing protein [Burkholderiaceae bacterium]|nr:ATP-binding cassette domain-containing protein [Burkholderiaceae bacterium]
MTELLKVSGLVKRFGGLTAVNDVSLSVARGEMKCIIGPNGAGKSTFLNMICGTLKPTEGHVWFEGKDITRLTLNAIAHLGIARKFQVPSVFERLTVRDNLEVARGGMRPSQKKGAMSVNEILDLMSLSDIANTHAGDIAHGQKQWLEIGMAMAINPKLLLLDEPTAGMTVEESLRTAELLKQAQSQFATIAIEHDMRFVRALECNTAVLHQGRLIADGTFAEVEQDPMVRDVYLGRS